ncbi:trehalose-phosphatase [Paracoccus sp. (in: a-proteobacteria)]|uniref:trehalose-phosphatase n=1 Tax=Paracoccus sp. TaxID=267 RepID=UPI0026DF2E0B|nr:trehalose-phosphatase [Paracoccus sp. (in: a-proteobacteria)]MDO5370183.1 trehalose-phosphatase [Paracoccus sp. (in: a-proteobacteria)]
MDQNSSREMAGAAPAPAGLPGRVDGLALFLDIDGTLLDIADTPDGIVVPPGLAGALERLTARLGGALALVTGRSLATVDRLFPGLSATVNGLHGAEWRDGSGRIFAPDTTDAFSGAKQRLREQAARWPGVVFEDKGPAFAAHYRLAPASEAQVRRLMQALAETVGDRWKLQEGKAVVELRPHGRDKGDALMQTMGQKAFAGRRPLAVGDDVTDEAMFAAANRLGGLSVRVGTDGRETLAQSRIPSPADLRAWVERVSQ